MKVFFGALFVLSLLSPVLASENNCTVYGRPATGALSIDRYPGRDDQLAITIDAGKPTAYLTIIGTLNEDGSFKELNTRTIDNTGREIIHIQTVSKNSVKIFYQGRFHSGITTIRLKKGSYEVSSFVSHDYEFERYLGIMECRF